MKFVLYGNFMFDFCSESHHAKSLEALGHQVVRLQETQIRTEKVLDEALLADGLIWIHSHGFHNPGAPMEMILQRLKEAKIPTIAYHLDLYMGLDRWKEYENGEYFQLEHFFTVDKLMAEWLNKNTKTKGYFLPAGVYHAECYDLSVPKKYDVVFVGSKGYHHEWPYRPKLIDFLKATYGSGFTHFGGDGVGPVRGHDLNSVYASSRVVVGDTLCKDFTYPYYLSDRIFETIGRGGFIIHPWIEGIQDFFDFSELVTYQYNNFRELESKINYYIRDDSEREKIRKAGMARVVKDHTYLKRWEKIIETIYGKQ